MRKGVSPMIATVLLIAITVTLASVIFSFGREAIQLSPAPSCDGIVFEAEIFKTQNSYTLEVNNKGGAIVAFNIEITDTTTEAKDIKLIDLEVPQGGSNFIALDFGALLPGKNLVISPLVANTDGKPTECRFESNSQTIEVTEIANGPIIVGNPIGSGTAGTTPTTGEVQGTRSTDTAGTSPGNIAQIT